MDSGEPYQQVVVAVHVDGTPWAFALSTDARMHTFALQPDSTWAPGPVSMVDHGSWSQLQVQYLPDRPSTAWVFATDPTHQTLRALSPIYPQTGHPDSPQWVEQTLPNPPAMSATWACGWEDPDRDIGTTTPVLRLYVLGADRKLTCYPFIDRGWSAPIEVAHVADGIIGTWFGMDDNLGVIYTQAGQLQLWSPTPEPEHMDPVTISTDFALADPVVWQDARGMLHIYGLHDNVLRGAHQTGWGKTVDGVVMPELLSVFVDKVGYVALTLPLRAAVDRFFIDAYPDTFPTQLVHRSGVVAQEAYALLSQDTTTRWWSEETMTLPGTTRRLVDRYVTTISVTDQYGAPVAGAHVTLSAESRTTVELDAGRSSRALGPDTRVQAITDPLGQVTIRQAPTGLTVPAVRVDVPGAADGLRIDAGAAVRSFLSGQKPLPNHPEGFVATLLHDARVDGEWLVPGWHTAGADDPLPTADDVVTWCREALGPAPTDGAAGWSLDLRGDADGAEDGGVPLLVRHSTVEELEAHLDTMRSGPSYGGVIPITDVFVPDLWEGIVEGALPVSQVTINHASQHAAVVLTWSTGTIDTQYELLVPMSTDADAAHVIEATFQWIGAEVARLLSWLSWGLDLPEVWRTTAALGSGMTQVSTLVKNLADHFLEDLPPTFFQDHEAQLDIAGNHVVDDLGYQTVSRFMDATSVPQAQSLTVASLANADDVLANPHLGWLRAEMDGLVPRPASAHDASAPRVSGGSGPSSAPDDAWTDFWAAFTESPAGVAFTDVPTVIGTSFRGLLDPEDRGTLLQVRTGDLVRALSPNAKLLALADTLVPATKTLADALADELDSWLATPLEDPALVEFVQWVAEQAGSPLTEAPTEGQLVALQAAFPLTHGFTGAMGMAPFPDGTFPTIQGLAEPEAGPPLIILAGAAPAVMAYMSYLRDRFYDSPAGIAPSGNPEYDGMKTKTYAYTRLLYALLDVLRLYKIPIDSNVLNSARWARAAGNLVLGLAEMYLAFRYRTTLNWVFGGRGRSLLVLWGLVQMWQSIQIYNLTPDADIRKVELWDGLLRAFPDATSFTRAWAMSRDLFRYHELKETLDALVHGFTALNGFNGVYQEIAYPLTITPIPNQTARVGQAFSLRVEVTGGWPPYSWRATNLPPGLDMSPDGLISGTPNQKGVDQVHCEVDDAFIPTAVARATFMFRVS